MPLYEYECKNCKEHIEKMQSFSDPLLTDCPKCGTENSLKKLISTSSVIYNGEGYYCKDSKKNNGCGCSGNCQHHK